MHNDNIPTRKDVLNRYASTPHAARVIADATASVRHEARVKATLEAAADLVASVGLEPTVAYIVAVLVVDHNGVGGTLNAGRHNATPRLLKTLGKGRWKACDGGAYEAALKDALYRVFLEAPSPGEHYKAGEVFPETVAELAPAIPARFRVSFATRAILALCEDIDDESAKLPADLHTEIGGTLEGWDAVLGAALAELEAERVAAETEAATEAPPYETSENPF
jgi:hypothetical protein